MMKKHPILFHVDMNSFYASVEINRNPDLKGKPLAIAGDPKQRRGIVVTSSYEARAKGVKTTMPVWKALRKCPDLLLLPPDFDTYREVSRQMFAFLKTYSSYVEPVSIDEGYMDMTEVYEGPQALMGARQLQAELYQRLGLPSSIGIAPNKFLAKTASDMKKPMGITVLRKRDVEEVLWPLDIIEMHGVGQQTEKKLKRKGWHTIGDIARADKEELKAYLGVKGELIYERAHGHDPRSVNPEAADERKSVGKSRTLPRDTDEVERIFNILAELSQLVAARLDRFELFSDNIQLTIRYGLKETITRSRKQNVPIYQAEDLYQAAEELWEEHWDGRPIRLIGITAQEVKKRHQIYKQLDLFSYKEDEREENLNQTLAHLTERFGEGAAQKGSFSKRKEDKN
ncbi:DNA polymerase IV [Salsuginibacillus kocurii]|uniref:DNA polymerase IV n=1 Tax=Salsuginibacillus kocurii TaxID=427078 RepID=UPI0003AAA022|nr:DNA polymerase IV [Salsuginibacillus kocurii]